MYSHPRIGFIITLGLFLLYPPLVLSLTLNEAPAQSGEWGYRPFDQQTVSTNPPAFVWRPQKDVTWELVSARTETFENPTYTISDLSLNVHCPERTFPTGTYYWRYRAKNQQGQTSPWSQTRSFTIPPHAVNMTMPSRSALLARVPENHPRLFMRPDTVDNLRSLAQGPLKKQYQNLVSQCSVLLRNPPSVKEPPTYTSDMPPKSEAWRARWWGNRRRVQDALGKAALLGFTWRIGGDIRFGREAQRILMACSHWDPKGSTGYLYNDEAGMPYNYYFARTYTFIYDLLTVEQRLQCRHIMKIRGEEMYHHLRKCHLWKPYASHANRAWHFLGEVALAFHGEIEGADDWLWFAMNVFYTMYPVWSDDDGGWHEGLNYWNSYQNRFTWWADIMREVLDLNAFDKPYYRQAGYYPMYLTPPHKVGAGFGDLNAPRKAEQNRELMTILAAQAQNPHWQWYVDQLGGSRLDSSYIGFIRHALPSVSPTPPHDLPTSKLFKGTGQAVLNTQITDARDSVQVVFKSSPFGTQSHGYEANNSFLLWAYGERLLIRSGYRDIYASDHHRNWMWSTRSVNNITINGKGQRRHSNEAQGEITSFYTSDDIDVVVGEAGSAYEDPLDQYTRTLVFIKPDLMVVFDQLRATKLSTFEYHLHALDKMKIDSNNQITIRRGDVHCQVTFHRPEHLSFLQTDQYDPNPHPRIQLREWHLTASTLEPAQDMTFVTQYRIYKKNPPSTFQNSYQQNADGAILSASVNKGTVTFLLPKHPTSTLTYNERTTTGHVLIYLKRHDQTEQTVIVE